MTEKQTEKAAAQPDDPLSASLSRQFIHKELAYFGPHSTLIGILLMLLGGIGLVAPQLLSLMSEGAIAGLLIAGGVLWGIHTFKTDNRDFMSWLKSLVLLAAGTVLMLFPLPGVASLVIFLAVYLTFDAVSSFTYAQRRKPEKGWGWMLANAIIDVLLAIVFFFGWPETSVFMLGIYVAVSLLFDGWALVIIGSNVNKEAG